MIKNKEIELLTNLKTKLVETEIQELKDQISIIGSLEIYDYRTKAIGIGDLARFIFRGFDILDFIRNSILWSIFVSLIKKCISLSKKYIKKREINVWLIDTSREPSINITFSISDSEPLLLDDLIGFLNINKNQITRKIKNKKIIWISYNREKQKWNILQL